MTRAQRVGDFMTTSIVALSPQMDVMRAIHRMIEEDVSGAPVVDENGRLVGIVTERDCLEIGLQAGYFGVPGGKLADFMITNVQTVTPQTGIVDLAQRLVNSSFRRFPVVESGVLVGMITRRDVLRGLFAE